MTGDELRAALKRHVGHTLRCERSELAVKDLEGWEVETVALRCEDCGEVVLEAAATVSRKRRTHART